MRTESVVLGHSQSGRPLAIALREPTGRDELAVEGVDTRAAVELLGRLLHNAVATPPPAAHLTATDRDALLAALHRRCWGDRIVTTLTCVACAARFDLSFELSALQRQLAVNETAWRARGDGYVADGRGTAYRVPRAEDEWTAVAAGSQDAPARLAAACGAEAEQAEAAAAALEAAAPIIDLELAAHCAECGHEQLAHFDVQSFVMQRFLNERELLHAQIDLLATGYGWSLREILSLSRSARRQLAERAGDRRARTPDRARAEIMR